jgi:type IV secretory pathway VirJ component
MFGLMLLATAAAGPAGGREIDAGRLGSLPLVVPEGAVQGVVFLFSDRSGWNADLVRAAARLSALGAAVLEVDLPAYLAKLGNSDDRDCH